ncbi:hypothetical protein Dimus_008256, partial [Dionaea muscipula]
IELIGDGQRLGRCKRTSLGLSMVEEEKRVKEQMEEKNRHLVRCGGSRNAVAEGERKGNRMRS